MAVYEHTYRPYAGPLTPAWSRFLIIPRHAFGEIFQSKLFTGLFAVSFVCPLIMAIIIYLHHNSNALALLSIRSADVIAINNSFFRAFVLIQSSLAFVMAVIVGPALVSRDLTNNALPLYLSRPFSRAEYIGGKMAVLIILLSAITWIPGLLLFAFQGYLEGGGWAGENFWIARAVLVSSLVWVIVLALLATALSAWIKWRVAASAALFAVFIIPGVVGSIVTELFRTPWGNLINLTVLIQTVGDALFRQSLLDLDPWMVMPAGGAWAALLVWGAGCLLLLARKVRAYEVIS
ncbi:MAG TPA: ABC-2 transporter permease [Blastocatellia bacterium]|nr:ABC-2 transporter permease [Blastocatellia bacterium]